MIQHKTRISQHTGPHIMFLGAIHGDEKCGPIAINRLMNSLEKGDVKLLKGSITCIPICNPKAYILNTRYVEENLGRCLYQYETPTSYEQTLAQELVPFIENVDLIVDLHSMGAQGQPFIFQDYPKPSYEELARATGIPLIVQGRPEIYAMHGQQDVSGYAYGVEVPCVVVECGQHNTIKENKMAGEIAKQVIQNVLYSYGIIAGTRRVSKKTIVTVMKLLYKKEKEGKLVVERKHGDYIKEGSLIAMYDDGERIVAQEDSYILLPRSGQCSIGDEWFYIGLKKESV